MHESHNLSAFSLRHALASRPDRPEGGANEGKAQGVTRRDRPSHHGLCPSLRQVASFLDRARGLCREFGSGATRDWIRIRLTSFLRKRCAAIYPQFSTRRDVRVQVHTGVFASISQGLSHEVYGSSFHRACAVPCCAVPCRAV